MAADNTAVSGAEEKTRVFISYSRRDMAFADRLEAALKARGCEALIDREEIYAFEDWWQRIEALIGRADTVVFVLSPDAVASEVALREIACAASLSKRFAPIVCRPVADAAVPDALRRLNFIFFDDPARFEAASDQLAEALQTDIGWIRQHTALGEAARHWSAAGRPTGLLLRPPALEEAEHWIATRPHNAPSPTGETQQFIAASRRGATRRRNILTASLMAGLVVALALAALAYWQRGAAVAQRDLAESRRLSVLAELVTSERLGGSWDTAMRLGVHAVRLALDLRPAEAERSSPRAALATMLWQSGLRLTLKGHQDAVWCAAFSPDGKRVVTSSSDETVRIWDAATGREILVLKGHGAAVQGVDFSPDGSRVVTASWDSTARIWDAATGKQLMVLSHDDFVSAAAFAPDGKRIVTASGDTARIWDAATGAQIVVLAGHGSAVNSADFNMSGTAVVTASEDGTARVWDAATGKQLSVFSGHDDHVNSAAFSPDGARVVSASSDHTVRIWDAVTGKELLVMPKQQQWVGSASFSPDGSKVLASVGDGTAHVWDAATADEIAVLHGDEDALPFASFSPDGARIVTASRDKTARIWELGRSSVAPPDGQAQAGGFSPDGVQVVIASDDGVARVFDAGTGAVVIAFGEAGSGSRLATFSPDGMRVVTAPRTGGVRIWDAHTGKQLMALDDGGGEVVDVRYSRNGERIVVASADGVVRIWDAASGKQLKALPKQTEISTAALSPDGTRVAIASDRSTAIWDVASGKRTLALPAHEFGVSSAVFSNDGAFVLAASSDQTARVSDAVTGNEVLTLKGHTNDVEDAAFNGDGTRIVTASKDKTVRIWDAGTGSPIAIIQGFDDWVTSAVFSADASRVATTANDKTARIWDVRFATMSATDLITEVCARRLRGITTLSQNEMRIAGYPVGTAPIDVCAPTGQ